MSDPIQRFASKFGGGAQTGMDSPTAQAIKENRSVFNPQDAADMKMEGAVTADMTIRQFLESQGLDVEGPVTQLVEWQMNQMEKADPLNKMKAIAGKGGANMPTGGMPPKQATGLPQGNTPRAGGGIADLQAALKGGA